MQANVDRIEMLERRLEAAENEMAWMRRRLRATWTCAFVGAVGAFVLGANPEARAQFGVTLASLNARLTAVEAKTAPITVSGDAFFITGKNVFIQDGSGVTYSDSGIGNLTVGYNASRVPNGGTDVRTGSHNLILGAQNNYSSHGGLVVGIRNTISGPENSITGGEDNVASGWAASVSGGYQNTASGDWASISGGGYNTASDDGASVSGGEDNVASGFLASVSGGHLNTASGLLASVSGGELNTASGVVASVSGGLRNTARGDGASVSGGGFNDAAGLASSVSGGNNRDIGSAAANTFDWRAGFLFQDF